MIKRLIKLLISIFYFIFDQIYYHLQKKINGNNAGRMIIIYYHAIKQQELNKFNAQMNLLGKKTRPISLTDYSEAVTKKEHKHFSSVTFDDGFQSFYDYAMPGLMKRKIPVTMFVPSKSLNQFPQWLDGTDHEDKKEKIMNKKLIMEISKNPLITIGSHGQYHKDLLSCDRLTSKNEISGSKDDMEIMLKKKLLFISFPYGNFNESHIEIAKDAGYRNAFSINPKTEYISKNDFLMGRVEVNPSDWPIEFYLKIMGAYNWFACLKTFKEKPFLEKIQSFILKIIRSLMPACSEK